MGYFDSLTEGSFTTTADGRRVFFPWGPRGRGYIIPSEERYQRVRRELNAFMMATVTPVFGLVIMAWYVAALVVGLLLLALYPVWIAYLLRGCQPSDIKLRVPPRLERLAMQARAQSAARLWFMMFLGAVFTAMGISLLIVDHSNLLLWLALTLFFGLGLALAATQLVLRRRPMPRRPG